jgi:hypothetical protein
MDVLVLAASASEGLAGLPGWLVLAPPIVAIAVALAFRQVLPALFLGVWVGAWLADGGDMRAIWSGLLAVPNRWVLEAIAPPDGDTSHASIIVFTVLIGGLVGIIARNGGTLGIVDSSPGSPPAVGAGRPSPVASDWSSSSTTTPTRSWSATRCDP